MFKKVVIVGVGLIGGSIGFAVKKKKLAEKVIGICRREISKEAAIKSGSVDYATLDFKEGLKDAELVIIASPVGKIVDIAKIVAAHADGSVILTDVGSTKEYITQGIERIIPDNIKYAGSHPMAGSEKSGVAFAGERLFEKSLCIITKTVKTDKKALDVLRRFWTQIGCRVELMTPKMHDAVIAHVSHLPHIAAFALAGSVSSREYKFAATSFRDTTRIASSDPVLWNDIFMTNKKAVMEAVSEYKKKLSIIDSAIRSGNSKRLIAILQKIKDERDKL